LFKTESTNKFSCVLSYDTEYGPSSLDLEVNRDLIDKAFEKENVNVDINGPQNAQEGDIVNLECIAGENC
jgi:hypothetical protein